MMIEPLTRMTVDSMLDLLMLSDDFSGDSVVAQSNEFRMTKKTVDCPFEELDRCDPLRLQPAASLHVCGRFAEDGRAGSARSQSPSAATRPPVCSS
jgi:hypothetical protein